MAPAPETIKLLVWAIVFTVLDILFLALRFWAALIIRRKISADDYFVVLSCIATFALDGVMIWGIFNGMGNKTVDLTAHQLSVQLQLIPAAYVTWTIATTSIKLSVLFLYIRIMTWSMVRKLSYVLMGLTVAYCVTFMTVFLTTCTPNISQLWNPRPDGHCRDLNAGQLSSVSTNLALDVLIIILPIPFLWSLKMSMRNKMVVTAAFSLGIITIAIMIWRIQSLTSASYILGSDFVKEAPHIALTTALELWLCIIIACIPTIGPVMKVYVKPMVTKLTGRSTSAASSSKGHQLITFGRRGLGLRRRDEYTYGLGSQDTIQDDTEALRKPHSIPEPLRNIRKDTVTISKSSTRPISAENLESFSTEITVNRPSYVRYNASSV